MFVCFRISTEIATEPQQKQRQDEQQRAQPDAQAVLSWLWGEFKNTAVNAYDYYTYVDEYSIKCFYN